MPRRIILQMLAAGAALFPWLPIVPATAAPPEGPSYQWKGGVNGLVDAKGRVLVQPGRSPLGQILQHLDQAIVGSEESAAAPGRFTAEHFADLKQARTSAAVHREEATGDWIVTQNASLPGGGLAGVGWSIGEIPLSYSIVVPGHSGVRLAADAPGTRHSFDYPQGWEAQLVIVEGPDHGFYVWADDPAFRYKRLVVSRGANGWRLDFIALANAPFQAVTALDSPRWRLSTYEGDWRVPARRYRQWMTEHLRPTPLERQQPAWVKDITCVVITGDLRPESLDRLAQRMKPAQTLIYQPSWRLAGYDRDYPDYEKVLPQFPEWLRRAKQLGFRVMLHTNYFGVDPLNAEYAQFEPYHVRSPWGKHETLWWLWEKSTPTIRFAYINPAAPAWRKRFIAAMVELVRQHPVDSLHLDQTLCIYNDHNGLIDGHTMAEGNLAIHRELRAALPEVALSGEGLNEVTCVYEAFAQRHAWGLHHSEGTWDRLSLKCAHPISSYLLLPYTQIYGYLGYVSPSSGQIYAAWNEAYEHWGVIPTLKPSVADLSGATPFARQFFDELAFWQAQRPRADLDGPWPSDVAMPFATADGRRAYRSSDGRLVHNNQVISRTVGGVLRAEKAGVVPGWKGYRGSTLVGLDPDKWYAVFPGEGDSTAFHVEALPDGCRFTSVDAQTGFALVTLQPVANLVADLRRDLPSADCLTVPSIGPATTYHGPMQSPDGATFVDSHQGLSAHPPYKRIAANRQVPPGRSLGMAVVRYTIHLPAQGTTQFTTQVALQKGNAGKSDGIVCRVSASAGSQRLSAEIVQKSDEPKSLDLDLTPLAGKDIVLELSVDPGPAGNPSFDSCRWLDPRVQHWSRTDGPVRLGGAGGYRLAIVDDRPAPISPAAGGAVELPGGRRIVLVAQPPAKTSVPLALDRMPFSTTIACPSDRPEDRQYAGASWTSAIVGGVKRKCLRVHPPNPGQTSAHFAVDLAAPARLRMFVGLADGSQSTGVVFQIGVNGRTVAERRMLPGKWEELEADLSTFAGRAALLSLTVDSDGPFNFDWACWGEPRLER